MSCSEFSSDLVKQAKCIQFSMEAHVFVANRPTVFDPKKNEYPPTEQKPPSEGVSGNNKSARPIPQLHLLIRTVNFVMYNSNPESWFLSQQGSFCCSLSLRIFNSTSNFGFLPHRTIYTGKRERLGKGTLWRFPSLLWCLGSLPRPQHVWKQRV